MTQDSLFDKEDKQLDDLLNRYHELKHFLHRTPVGYYADKERELEKVRKQYNKLVEKLGLWEHRIK